MILRLLLFCLVMVTGVCRQSRLFVQLRQACVHRRGNQQPTVISYDPAGAGGLYVFICPAMDMESVGVTKSPWCTVHVSHTPAAGAWNGSDHPRGVLVARRKHGNPVHVVWQGMTPVMHVVDQLFGRDALFTTPVLFADPVAMPPHYWTSLIFPTLPFADCTPSCGHCFDELLVGLPVPWHAIPSSNLKYLLDHLRARLYTISNIPTPGDGSPCRLAISSFRKAAEGTSGGHIGNYDELLRLVHGLGGAYRGLPVSAHSFSTWPNVTAQMHWIAGVDLFLTDGGTSSIYATLMRPGSAMGYATKCRRKSQMHLPHPMQKFRDCVEGVLTAVMPGHCHVRGHNSVAQLNISGTAQVIRDLLDFVVTHKKSHCTGVTEAPREAFLGVT